MNEKMIPTLRKAESSDIPEVGKLYRLAVGRPGCTWNDLYPTLSDAENDLAHGCLFVGEFRSEVMAAISVVPENELDGYAFFEGSNPREIARVTVSERFSGKGFAVLLLRQLFSILKAEKAGSVRLLAAKGNSAALKTYEKLGFQIRGEVFEYGSHYFAEELIL